MNIWHESRQAFVVDRLPLAGLLMRSRHCVAYARPARSCPLSCRCPLDTLWPGSEGLSNEITWVSLLLDLKRGEGGNKQFQRSMSEYYSRFQRIIDRGFKMVIFVPKEFEQHLKLDTS